MMKHTQVYLKKDLNKNQNPEDLAQGGRIGLKDGR